MSQSDGAEPRFEGSVTAAFPLALLESVRSHDHPGEVLEDEDLSVSLPRRLGLTGVVGTQIMRYEGAQKAGRPVQLNEVVSLIRLVMRRPDAEPILRETGERYARWRLRNRPAAWSALLHRAPNLLGLRAARRAALHALRSIHAGEAVNTGKPFSILVRESLTHQIEADGAACLLFTGLIEEVLLLSTGIAHRVGHTECVANGALVCEWSLADAAEQHPPASDRGSLATEAADVADDPHFGGAVRSEVQSEDDAAAQDASAREANG
jgi:hypothetical protein